MPPDLPQPGRSTPDLEAQLAEIHTLAIELGLADDGRRALLIPDAQRRARVPAMRDPAAQLLADLQSIATEQGPAGSRPWLVEWLRIAATLTGPRPAAARFRRWATRFSGPGPDGVRLRPARAEPPGPPTAPYPPVLGYYTDRRLFAGRDRERQVLRQRVERVPVLCLWARSGAGKSSLIAAGLVPDLRDEAIPAAVSRAPHEASAPRLLLRGLVDPAPERIEPRGFARIIEAAHRLAGCPPVLVLDQFEEVFKGPDARAARARLGPYLAATIGPGPALGDGVERPLCRWVLAYRHEFHGDVKAWLRDVLAEAREDPLADLEGLPHDLTVEGRSDEWPLPLFGTAPSGAAPSDAARAAHAAFKGAIMHPLPHVDPPWTMGQADADRLAGAFAAARLRDADQPLVPELQVVLARLVDQAEARGSRALAVAEEDLEAQIADALRQHVLASIERVLPTGPPGVRQRRALLLTALARLVDDAGRRSRRLLTTELAPVLGADGSGGDGARLLEALTGPGVRVLTVEADDALGRCYALAHDRLAEVIAALVDDPPYGTFDPETLALVEFVHRRVELHRHGDPAALARDEARFEALVESPGVRQESAQADWWAAWCAETERLRAEDAARVAEEERRAAEAAERRRAAQAEAERRAAEAAERQAAEAERARTLADERRRNRWIVAMGAVVVAALIGFIALNAQNEQLRVQLDGQLEGHRVALASSDGETALRGMAGLVALGQARTVVVEEALERGANLSRVMPEVFVDDAAQAEAHAELRLAWVTTQARPDMVQAGAESTLERVERIGRLLAALAVARHILGPRGDITDARERVIETLRGLFEYPKAPNGPPMDAAALRGEMLSLPGGEFEMGSPDDEPGRDRDEVLHRVRVSPFAIGVTEVTAGQFRRLVPDHQPGDDDRLPAREVSWYAATAYAAWVGARLPTEAEWEYAARDQGRQRGRWCNGDDPEQLGEIAWVRQGPTRDVIAVRERAPCGGLYDMHGNVSEWTSDWYGPYASASSDAPLADPAGPATGTLRVVRGGSFWSSALGARSAYRHGWRPDNRGHFLGFRVVRAPRAP